MSAATTLKPWMQGYAPSAHWVLVPGMRRGINASSAERAAHIVQCVNAHDDLVAALETAKAGLEWYKDTHPESVDGSDDEAMAQIDAALAKAGVRP